MRGFVLFVSVVALAACTSTEKPRSPTPAQSRPAEPKPQPTPPTPPEPAPSTVAPEPPPPPLDNVECEPAIERYLAARKRHNLCEKDSDCAEIWPGVCPHGPYYVHEQSDMRDVERLVDHIQFVCELPECEAPRRLGPAHCVDNKCASGRPPPSDDTCWDTPVQYVELDQPRLSEASEHLQGITPLWGIGVPAAGKLTITADWSKCTDCKMLISERNFGMGSPLEGKRSRSGDSETIVVDAKPEAYYLLPLGKGQVKWSASLSRSDGEEARVNRVGLVHYRMCED